MSTRILKADGSYELFMPEKLHRSLRNSGASEEEIAAVIAAVERELHEGMRTERIYRRAFALLRKIHRPAAARYSMRRALFDLGPTGFPFEDFVARLFKSRGYETHTRTQLPGACVSHEIDLIGHKGDECFVAEAKFHVRPGIKSDVQTVLYSYARFMDLQGTPIPFGTKPKINKVYVVTNTKFTAMAEAYARCKGMELLSWTGPKGGTLQGAIEDSKLYPITVIPSLTRVQKAELIKKGAILCKDILDKPNLLTSASIAPGTAAKALEEGKMLCGI